MEEETIKEEKIEEPKLGEETNANNPIQTRRPNLLTPKD